MRGHDLWPVTSAGKAPLRCTAQRTTKCRRSFCCAMLRPHNRPACRDRGCYVKKRSLQSRRRACHFAEVIPSLPRLIAASLRVRSDRVGRQRSTQFADRNPQGDARFAVTQSGLDPVERALLGERAGRVCARLPARCRGDRLEAARLALPVRSILGMDQDAQSGGHRRAEGERSENWNK